MASPNYSDDEIDYESSEDEAWVEEDLSNPSSDENEAPSTGQNIRERSFGDYDNWSKASVPVFNPERPPGAHIPESMTRGSRRKYLTPLAIFQLFFSSCVVQQLCFWTNENAMEIGPTKPSMWKGWVPLEEDEFYRFIGFLMYMGMVQVPNVEMYWCKKSLFNGLWARSFMTRFRFQQIMCFLKVSDRKTEKQGDKLCKVRFLFDIMRRKCMNLYQPGINISIDERMVRNKGRFSFRQYIRDKPTKWGMKLWVLADSMSGYTYNFEVYLGKTGSGKDSKNGLAYDVVMNLLKFLLARGNKGYRLFVDNFYSSIHLFIDLLEKGIAACGTILCNRKGFPAELKNVKQWEKKKERGTMRWCRQGNILALQWKDNKTVSVISTMHGANEFSIANRRTKIDGAFQTLEVRQPEVIKDYNMNMSGVDKSDQLLTKYNMLRKTNKYWKTLFFHFLDIARVNSYILFQDWRNQNPDVKELNRSKKFNQLAFTEELIRQLGKIDDYEDVPTASKPKVFTGHPIIPGMVPSSQRKNCKKCYDDSRTEQKTRVYCNTCNIFLCFSETRNCLVEYHKI